MSVAEDWTVRSRAPRHEIDLARTGPDTPGGKFMRRFWMPVHRSADLPQGQAKPIRVMSEDFCLYRGESGVAQPIDYRCPHRGAMIILWRKIMEREFRAIEEGRPTKQWTPAPAEVVPTLGF